MRSSYSDEDVILLLKDITGLVKPQPAEEREKLIQSGKHYSEMLPVEYVPTDQYIKVYNKNFILEEKEIIEISKKLFSVCLLICVKGQTKEMIENDIKIALENFQGVTINIFINNGTVIERDNELVKWFIEKYSYLALDDRIELLLDNKDLGVFEQ